MGKLFLTSTRLFFSYYTFQSKPTMFFCVHENLHDSAAPSFISSALYIRHVSMMSICPIFTSLLFCVIFDNYSMLQLQYVLTCWLSVVTDETSKSKTLWFHSLNMFKLLNIFKFRCFIFFLAIWHLCTASQCSPGHTAPVTRLRDRRVRHGYPVGKLFLTVSAPHNKEI